MERQDNTPIDFANHYTVQIRREEADKKAQIEVKTRAVRELPSIFPNEASFQEYLRFAISLDETVIVHLGKSRQAKFFDEVIATAVRLGKVIRLTEEGETPNVPDEARMLSQLEQEVMKRRKSISSRRTKREYSEALVEEMVISLRDELAIKRGWIAADVWQKRV